MLGSAVSFLVAALSGMGIGSGGFLVIWLSLAEQMPQLTAQGINLLFFLFSSGASLAVHIRQRQLFAGAILVMSLAGMIASPLGSLAAAALPSDILRKIFGGMLIVSGLIALRKNVRSRKKQKKTAVKKEKPLYKK